jgi:shikimate kinase
LSQRHIVLVGMMGSGKTAVGRRVAERLGRPFLDIDRVVEEEAGCSVAEVFAAEGEAGFRRREAEVVSRVLASEVPAVIAFGGGAVLDPANRVAAREACLVIWLQAPAGELARRVTASSSRPPVRPLLAGSDSPETALAGIAHEREESYRAAAHVVIDTAGRSPGQVASAVLRAAAR